MNDALRRQYKIDSSSEGLVITDVDKDSPAYYEEGVREGDLIVELNGQEVRTAADLTKAVGNDDSIVLMIEREGSTYFLQVEKAKK